METIEVSACLVLCCLMSLGHAENKMTLAEWKGGLVCWWLLQTDPVSSWFTWTRTGVSASPVAHEYQKNKSVLLHACGYHEYGYDDQSWDEMEPYFMSLGFINADWTEIAQQLSLLLDGGGWYPAVQSHRRRPGICARWLRSWQWHSPFLSLIIICVCAFV